MLSSRPVDCGKDRIGAEGKASSSSSRPEPGARAGRRGSDGIGRVAISGARALRARSGIVFNRPIGMNQYSASARQMLAQLEAAN